MYFKVSTGKTSQVQLVILKRRKEVKMEGRKDPKSLNCHMKSLRKQAGSLLYLQSLHCTDGRPVQGDLHRTLEADIHSSVGQTS